MERIMDEFEAERGLVSLMAIDKPARDYTLGKLTTESLESAEARKVFKKISQLWKEGQPIDKVVLAASFQGTPDFEGISWFLSDGLDYSGGEMMAEPYIEAILERNAKKRLGQAARNITDSLQAGESSSEIAASAEEDLSQLEPSSDPELDIGKALDGWLERIKQLRAGDISPVRFGIPKLDGATGGLYPGELVLIGGRPGMGKSAFLIQLCNNALEEQHKVLFFSHEMSRDAVISRLVSQRTGLHAMNFRTGELTDHDFETIEREMEVISQLPLRIVDSEGMSMAQIRSLAKREASRFGVDLILLDYFQMIPLRLKSSEQRVSKFTDMIYDLRRLGGELGVPVVASAQLNRALEGRDDKRPRNSDLRESGGLEQAADIIIMLHRNKKNDLSLSDDVMELLVTKARHGEEGKTAVIFEPKTMSFDLMSDNELREYFKKAS